MQLKSLELQGFKSFPNKIKLDFDKGITAVVGPNGSGKSNISDAIRWVLGEQSSKSLRGSKMEDVIFDGTRTRKSQGFAMVSLTLDNSDRKLPVDNDDVTVTRRYYRSGESEYKINGASVRLRDLHEIFMDTGLGRDGYSMVGQGQIDSIISSKSEDRREIFEEAAGISRYRYRKIDAQRKLSQAEENLVRLRDILSELETRVEPLKIQANKAERFLVLAEQKKKLEIGLWLSVMNNAKQSLHEQEDKIAFVTARYEEAERELIEFENKNREYLEKMQEYTAKIDEIKNSSSDMEGNAVKKDGEAAVIENTILHNNETIQRIARDMESSEDTERDIDRQIAEKNNVIGGLEKLISEKNDGLKSLSETLADVQHRDSESSEKAVGYSLKITELSSFLADSRLAASSSASSAEEIKSRLSAVDDSIAVLKKRISELESERDEFAENVAFCDERIEELKNALNGHKMRVEQRQKKGTALREEADKLKLEIQQKLQRAKMLADLEKNMEGYQNSVKAVMREAKRGTLTGIHGTVSQLISVDDRYSTAIETAMGNGMQNIVTDDSESAKRSIYFLKNQKEGRATFLPLTGIKPSEFRETGVEQHPGVIGIASELVNCDERYKVVLKSLLGRTVVAEDLDYATALAKKYSYRFRIVTLDGQIINAGGSMTGGSRVHNAGILSRANEVKKLNSEAEELGRQEAVIEERLEEARRQYAASAAELEAVQSEITSVNEDKIRQESEQKLATEQIISAENSIVELEAEKNTSGERIEQLRRSYREAEENVTKYTAELREYQSKLEKLTNDREGSREKVEKLNEQISQIKMEILTAQKDIDAQREAIAVLESRRSGHVERAKQIQSEIEEINKNNELLKIQVETLKSQAQRLRQDAVENRSTAENMIKQRADIEIKSERLRRQERERSSERESLHTDLVRLEERKSAAEREYDDTVKRLFDEYGMTKREAMETATEVEDSGKAQRMLNDVKSRIRELGNVNVAAIDEYKEVSMRYEFMSRQISDVENSKNEIIRLIDELTAKMSEQFTECFNRINESFNVTFGELFGGGQARLVLVTPDDVLSSPIDIHIQPPGKNVKNISLFSGGEKALSAIALLFAILKENPAPFCVFDEIEAALDDVNVDRYAQYLRKMSVNTQFITITHRRGTMEEADVLYGVTMQEKGISTLLELKTAQMVEELKLNS